MSELKYFYTTVKDGPMNTNRLFYNDKMTSNEIKADFRSRRKMVGRKEGFDGTSIIIPSMKSKNNDLYEDGKYKRITNEIVKEALMKSRNNDLYDYDVEADILTMDHTVVNVALCYPVADCPVVFIKDNYIGAVSMAHCGGEYIDRYLPSQMVDAMQKEYNSRLTDLSVYVGPFIHGENYKWDTYPTWATNNKLWENCIKEEKGNFFIYLDEAINKQLIERGIDKDSICISTLDTYTNPLFYSNSASKKVKEKNGRFYEGCFYKIK